MSNSDDTMPPEEHPNSLPILTNKLPRSLSPDGQKYVVRWRPINPWFTIRKSLPRIVDAAPWIDTIYIELPFLPFLYSIDTIISELLDRIDEEEELPSSKIVLILRFSRKHFTKYLTDDLKGFWAHYRLSRLISNISALPSIKIYFERIEPGQGYRPTQVALNDEIMCDCDWGRRVNLPALRTALGLDKLEAVKDRSWLVFFPWN